MRPLHSRHFLLLAVGVLGSAPALQCQTQQQAQMVRPFTISSGGQDVQLAAGQTVTVLGIANGKATIRADLPNGSMGIAQIPADLVHQGPASAAAKPAATPSPSVSPAKPTSTGQTKATPPASQFSLNPGTASSQTSRDGSKTVHKDWKLVWSDEFNGPVIDASKWGFEVNGEGGGNGELQFSATSTSSPSNGRKARSAGIWTASFIRPKRAGIPPEATSSPRRSTRSFSSSSMSPSAAHGRDRPPRIPPSPNRWKWITSGSISPDSETSASIAPLDPDPAIPHAGARRPQRKTGLEFHRRAAARPHLAATIYTQISRVGRSRRSERRERQ